MFDASLPHPLAFSLKVVTSWAAGPWVGALMALMMVWLTTISFGVMMGQLKISRYLYVLARLFTLFFPGKQFFLCAFLWFIISFSSLYLFFISSSLLMFHKKYFIHWIEKFTFKITFRSSWLACLWGLFYFRHFSTLQIILKKFDILSALCFGSSNQ